MANKDELDALSRARDEWVKSSGLDESRGGRAKHRTDSKFDIAPVYSPLDLEEAGYDYAKDTGWPGQFPYVRGIEPDMYRDEPWLMMQYSGFASAAETNKRFKYMLSQGATSYSVALDLPTHKALDSDDPLAEGEVGKTGVPIDSLRSLEEIFEGIPLDAVKMFTFVNMSGGPIFLAMILALAEKRGVDPAQFGLFITNESLIDMATRGTQYTTPEGHFRLSSDVVEYCARNHPNFSPLQISGYHPREAGCNAVQELAFPLSVSIEYIEEMAKRGLSVDEFAGSFHWFLSASMDFLEEVAKFRAFRKIWARLTRDRFGAKVPKTMQADIMIYSGGSHLTRQQPQINISRTTVQALAAALGGVQYMNLSSYDEAFQTPTEESATIAIRIQQILANETGVTKTVDPLAGSYYIESLTKQIEEGVNDYLAKIEAMGGAVKAIKAGFFQSEIAEQAYEHNREIQTGERVKIGLNKFTTDDPVSVAPLQFDENSEREAVQAVKKLRAERDSEETRRALDNLEAVLKTDENCIPAVLAAVKALATVGEIGKIIRKVLGEYKEEITHI